MIKSCIICDTPIQIMNALILKNGLLKDSCVDLYVGKYFSNVDMVIRNLRKTRIFNNIYCYDVTRLTESIFTRNGECKKLVQYYFPRLYFKILLCENSEIPNYYDKIFMGSIGQHGLAMMQLNKTAKMYLYDDGLNSYYGNHGLGEIKKRLSPLRKYMYRILGYDITHFYPSALYVNSPMFCESTWNCTIMPLKEQDVRYQDIEELLSLIFEYARDEIYDKNKIVFLSQPNDSEDMGIEITNEKVERILLNHGIVFRRHPREKKPYLDGVLVDKKRNLWELLCARQITDNHCLISNFSTAAFIPKLMFDKEPTLLFLCPLYEKYRKKATIEDMLKTISRLQSLYSEPQKVVLIRSFEQLKEVLEYQNCLVQ